MTVKLPINYLDTGKVARDKINNSFNEMVDTVRWYRPHIENGIWYIWDTNTWVKAYGDSIDMKVEDWYIWYKSESQSNWTQIIAIADLKWDKGDKWDPFTYDDFTEEQLVALTWPQWPQWPQWVQGVPWEWFEVYKTYSSISAMNADKNNVPEWKFVMITSNVEDPDNAMLYVKWESDFTFLTDMSWATGMKWDRWEQGIPWTPWTDWQDWYSPTATVSKVWDTATITITDKNWTTTAEVHDWEWDVTDVLVDGVSVLNNKVASIDLSWKQDVLTEENAWTDIDITNIPTIDTDVEWVSPITLENSIEDGLNSITALGKCQQIDKVLPSAYARLDYVSSPSSSRIDTGIIWDETTVITAKRRPSVLEAMYVYACQSSNNTRWITAYLTSTTWNWRYGSQTYQISFEAGKRYTTVQSADGVNVNGTVYEYGTVSEFTTPYTIILGTSHSSTGWYGTAYFQWDLWEFKIEKWWEVVVNYIPCKRVSDGRCWFYDTVSETFKVSATTNHYAEWHNIPSPTNPVPIECNNGELKFFYGEKFTTVGQSEGYIIGGSSGEITENSNYNVTDLVFLKAGAYTGTYKDDLTVSWARPFTAWSYDNGTPVAQIFRESSRTGQVNTFTFTVESDCYVRFSYRTNFTDLSVHPTNLIIYADGTQETIRIWSKNLWDTSAEIGKWVGTNGDVATHNTAKLINFPAIEGETFTLSAKFEVSETANNILLLNFRDSDNNNLGRYTYTIVMGTDGGSVTATAPADTAYIYAAYYRSTPISIQLEKNSTATDYEPYFDWWTATVENLLAVGDYVDEQEILTGGITREVGIKVFDGTEDWSIQNTYNFSITKASIGTDTTTLPNYSVKMKSNYFPTANYATKNDSVWSGNTYINFRAVDTFATLEGWKAWVASKYQEWNPLILIYPLATPTTESVTPQTLTTQEWDNTVTATWSIPDLEIEANYTVKWWTTISFSNESGYVTEADIPEYTAWTWISISDDYVISATWWGGNWDVSWPDSSVNGHLAVFDGATWKLLKDGWEVPTPVTVVDNLTSTSTTSALSANQWKILNDKIADLMWMWKFLSLWNCTTWQPISFPLDTPYTYHTWDYFMVEVLDYTSTIYRPNWSSYNNIASSTEETGDVAVWDYYVYDWAVWLLASNHWKTASFANITGEPSDNAELDAVLDWKQNTWIEVTVQTAYNTVAKVWTTADEDYVPHKWDWLLVNFVNGCSATSPTLNIDWSGAKEIRIWNATVGTTTLYLWSSSWTNVTVLMYYDGTYYKTRPTINTTYSAMTVSEWQTGTSTSARLMRADRLRDIIKYHAIDVSGTAPSSPTEWQLRYDSTNNVLKTYNGSSWDTSAIKMTVLTYWSSTWNDFLKAYNSNSIVYCKASSNADPSSWDKTRYAFLAYVHPALSRAEFQYYRSVATHTIDNQVDEVYVYNISNAGVWTVTTRKTWPKIVASTWLSATYADDTLTLTNTQWFNPWSWTTGQVLTKTANGYGWANASGWIQNDTTWTTSTIDAEWVWTLAEFNALSSYWNKIYNIIE